MEHSHSHTHTLLRQLSSDGLGIKLDQTISNLHVLASAVSGEKHSGQVPLLIANAKWGPKQNLVCSRDSLCQTRGWKIFPSEAQPLLGLGFLYMSGQGSPFTSQFQGMCHPSAGGHAAPLSQRLQTCFISAIRCYGKQLHALCWGYLLTRLRMVKAVLQHKQLPMQELVPLKANIQRHQRTNLETVRRVRLLPHLRTCAKTKDSIISASLATSEAPTSSPKYHPMNSWPSRLSQK